MIKVEVESEKVGLKLNIQKTKIMASGPITSWEIDGETVETVSDFMFFLDWRKHKLDSRLLGETSITSDMQMTPPLRQKVKN